VQAAVRRVRDQHQQEKEAARLAERERDPRGGREGRDRGPKPGGFGARGPRGGPARGEGPRGGPGRGGPRREGDGPRGPRSGPPRGGPRAPR
jgi:hypothetical protein